MRNGLTTRIMPSTLLRQQSFKPDWLQNGVEDIPYGVIIALQITTKSTDPIMLSSLYIDNGSLSIVFEQSGLPVAYASGIKGGEIAELTVSGSVMSATIETGVVPNILYNKSFSESPVSGEYIHVVSPSQREARRLVVVQDNTTASYDILNDMTIEIKGIISVSRGAEDSDTTTEQPESSGNISLYLTDEDYKDLFDGRNEIISVDKSFRDINGVTTSSGEITVNIYINGSLIPVNKISESWIELSLVGETLCPGLSDTIDSYISPATHIGYMPLDDMYNENNVRDTQAAKEKLYGGFIENYPSVGLISIDPAVDDPSEEP